MPRPRRVPNDRAVPAHSKKGASMVSCTRILRCEEGCVPVTILVIGPIDNNTLIVSDGRQEGAPAMVVDPSGDPDAIMSALGWFTLERIVLTHNHHDHVAALPELVERTGAQVFCHAADAGLIERGQENPSDPEHPFIEGVPVDRKVADGDVVRVGSLEFQVIHTPGHTKGGICLYLPAASDDAGIMKPGILLSGDTLFCGATGRVDFEGGSAREMRRSMREKLAPLPDATIVFPGHENLTTIGMERHRTIEAF